MRGRAPQLTVPRPGSTSDQRTPAGPGPSVTNNPSVKGKPMLPSDYTGHTPADRRGRSADADELRRRVIELQHTNQALRDRVHEAEAAHDDMQQRLADLLADLRTYQTGRAA